MAINPDKIVVQDEAYYTPRTDIYDKDTLGPVLQLGVTLKHFTGDLYMKLSHFHYIATQKLGYLAPADAEELNRTIEDLKEENESLKAQLKEKEEEEQNDFNERLERLMLGFNLRNSASGDSSPVANAETDNSSKPAATGKSRSKGKTSDISLDDL